MPEHTILIAFTVEADTRAEAHEALMQRLPSPNVEVYKRVRIPTPITSWWVAEDDRIDGSDNDSAVFVHKGHQGPAYWALISKGHSGEWNYPHRRPQ